MPQSAFIVRVPEAEALVRELRNRFDASSRLGVPAHVTVLFPFMSPERVTAVVLAEVKAALQQVPAFTFRNLSMTLHHC